MKKNRVILPIFMVISLLCASCGAENTTGLHTGNATDSSIVSGTAVSDTAVSDSDHKVENKNYDFTLPKLDVFREELEDVIYWTHATAPTKEEDESNIYSYLKKNKALGKNLKVKLLHSKSLDNDHNNKYPCYGIYINFPELMEKEQYVGLGNYSAGGMCDVDYFTAGVEIHSKKERQKNYVDWGETTIYIDEEKAERYVPKEDTSGVREQIKQDCLNEIKKYCDGNEYEIYLHDFLPGDQWIVGEVLYHNPVGFDVVSYLQIQVYYNGKKMERYSRINWFDDADYAHPEDLEDLEFAEETIIPEHCFMAYHVKGDQITSLKQE